MNTTDFSAWTERAPVTLARAGCAVAAMNSGVVAAGGSYWRDGQKYFTDRVDRYDPVTNRWSELKSLPQPRGDASAAVVAERMYVIGGGASGPGERSVQVFTDGRWTEDVAMKLPESRRSAVAVVMNETIYLVGGLSGTGSEFSTSTSTLWSARPGQGWRVCAPMPGPARFNAAVAVIGEAIIVAGGCTPENNAVRNLDTILRFDARTNQWTEIGRLPFALRGAWGLADGSRVIVLGGYTDRFLTSVHAVDARTGDVTLVGELPCGLADARFVRAGARIIGVTGENGIKLRFEGTIEARLSSPPLNQSFR